MLIYKDKDRLLICFPFVLRSISLEVSYYQIHTYIRIALGSILFWAFLFDCNFACMGWVSIVIVLKLINGWIVAVKYKISFGKIYYYLTLNAESTAPKTIYEEKIEDWNWVWYCFDALKKMSSVRDHNIFQVTTLRS